MKMHREINEIHEIRVHINIGKNHVYMWLHTASIKSAAGNGTRIFPSPFQISTSSRLTFAGAFRNDYVAAYSTALRSATEEKESG